MKANKILILISNLEFGGAQRQVIELVNNMDISKCEIHVCSLSNYVPLASQLNPQINLHIINKKAKFDFSVVFKLVLLIKKYQFNIIHSYLFDAEIAARLAGRLSFSGIKIIGSERNANYTLKTIQKRAYKLTKGMVDKVIANSQSGADYNSQQTGVPSNKYDVVYNGVDTHRFKPLDAQSQKSQLGIDKNTKVIGMFASFKQQKNHPLLIRSLEKVKQEYSNFVVLLVGDMLHAGLHGSDIYCDAVKKSIQNTGLKDNVIYLGNRNDVEELYPVCDFTVLPSLYEGTPNVILESMSCGVPVIATNVSDNAKIVSNGKNGFIVDLDDEEDLTNKILFCLREPCELKELSQHARTHMVNYFSSQKLAENMQLIYCAI